MRRQLLSLLILLSALPAGSALAWKPVMHEFLAEQTYRDLMNRSGSFVESRIQHETGQPRNETFSALSADPLVYQALQDHPGQYRAGVLGPDAYPDLLTGQSVIHPDDDEGVQGHGADAWLSRLWDVAYSQALSGDDRPLAFMAGFLTHAAGDMYAHSFVNHYSGGPFELGDNAITHIVVEGFVGERTPPLPADWYEFSIEGVEDFLYEQTIDATRHPRTPIYDLYLKKAGSKWTLPRLFGEIRSFLEDRNDDWRSLSYPHPSKILGAPLHAYRKAWQEDIDKGLRHLPAVSIEVARHLFYNPARVADTDATRDVLDSYFHHHMLSMLGAPDIAVEFIAFINDATNWVMNTLNIPNPLAALQDRVLDYLAEKATGTTFTGWKSYLTSPTPAMVTVPRLINANPTLCPSTPAGPNTVPLPPGHQRIVNEHPQFADCKHEIEAQMALNHLQFYRWERFAPAFNTVRMSKLLLLGGPGRESLMQQLGYPAQVPLRYNPQAASTAVDNAMVGFMRSLDGSRQWSEFDDQMVAHFDCYLYSKLFTDQKGARDADQAPLTYRGGEALPHACPDVDTVQFERGPLGPEDAICASDVQVTITLDEPADDHGAVVELSTVGPAHAEPVGVVPGSSPQVTTRVWLDPVSSEQTIEVSGSRMSNGTDTWRIRPPYMDLLRAQRRRVGGYANVVHGDAFLGGTELRTEARLDCQNPSEQNLVVTQACALSGPLGCETAYQPGRPGDSIYPGTLDLPAVTVDTPYRLTGTFINSSVSMDITLLASRVLRIELDQETVSLGFGSQMVTATVIMNGPAAEDEQVFLRYAPGLVGPPSVIVPAGQSEVTFTVEARASLLSNQCESTVGWVEAISEKDASAAGLDTGRERYAELVMQQGDGIHDCLEAMHPDPRLEHVARVLKGEGFGFPPIIFEPEDGLIGPWLK